MLLWWNTNHPTPSSSYIVADDHQQLALPCSISARSYVTARMIIDKRALLCLSNQCETAISVTFSTVILTNVHDYPNSWCTFVFSQLLQRAIELQTTFHRSSESETRINCVPYPIYSSTFSAYIGAEVTISFSFSHLAYHRPSTTNHYQSRSKAHKKYTYLSREITS